MARHINCRQQILSAIYVLCLNGTCINPLADFSVIFCFKQKYLAEGVPVAVPDKNCAKIILLVFLYRCHLINSLFHPQGALVSAPYL